MKKIKIKNRNKISMKTMMLKFFASFLIVLSMQAIGLSQCAGITMSCNNNLQITLNDYANGCNFVVTPGVILQNQSFPDSDYLVTIEDENGDVVPNATITSAEVGQTISITVTHIACNLACWGYALVEDKTAPVLDCGSIVTVACDANTDPVSVTNPTGIPLPSIFDCSSTDNVSYEDIIGVMTCTGTVGFIIDRYWTVADAWGNSSTCIQEIAVERGDLADVTLPGALTFECDEAIVMNASFPNPDFLEAQGYEGLPTNLVCENILYSYTDSQSDLCGVGYKVFRQWMVVDWCTGQELNGLQVIKVEDTAGPIVTCPTNVAQPSDFGCEPPNVPNISIFLTTDEMCEGTLDVVPPPVVVNECSSYTWTVAYKHALPGGGEPPANTAFETDNVSIIGYDGEQPIYKITNFPFGASWLQYLVTDACGFTRECRTELYVYDVTPPTAICEGGTVLTLNTNECKTVFATSIDDNSWDACSTTLDYKISRSNSNYQESLDFCCSDVGNVTVYLRVTDECGNSSYCTGTVVVEDAIGPSISCPANATVGCNDSTHPNATGWATGSGNCSNPQITYQDGPVTELYCNTGYFTRTWTATSSNGQSVTCSQTITIESDDPLTSSDVNWPASTLHLTGCVNSINLHPDVIGSTPTVSNSSTCVDIGISFSDEELYFSPVEGICRKVRRTWVVTDWCLYNTNLPVTNLTFEQIIHVDGGGAPLFNNCNTTITVDAVNDCLGIIDVTKSATHECASNLAYNWELDLDSNGTIDESGIGNSVYGVYSSGNHKLTFYAVDDCGNIGMCMCTVQINDQEAPTPICYAEVIWPMDPNGIATVWASDFNIKSEDTCDPYELLHYSFTPDGNTTALSFDCSDLPNGIGAEIPLQMYVIDTDGNYEFCQVTLILQDNGDYCTDMSNATAKIEGRITNEMGEDVDEVEVELMNVTDNQMAMEMTDLSGDYAFANVDFYDGYSIDPKKEDDPLNGVSTLDLVLIQKHLLSTLTLDSPFKLIAADVNGSDHVSATDLIELRKLILGIFTDFPNNDSYIFVDESYEFMDPEDPWNYTSNIDINELYVDETEANFVAVKVGDVNNSAIYNATSASTNRNDAIDLVLLDQSFEKGETVVVNFALDQVQELVGFQFNLSTNGSLKLNTITANSIELNATNYRVNELNNIAVSWNDINANLLESNLLTMSFTALTDGVLSDVIEFNTQMNAEMYTSQLEAIDLKLRIEGDVSTSADFVLYQNNPNPFVETTNISFNAQESGDYELRVLDLNGKVLKSLNGLANKGINTTEVSLNDITASGLFYYQLTIGDKTATKKMIVVK